MERKIYRGSTLIGRVIHPAESGAPVYGTDVLALSEFGHVDPDADTQFESSDQAEELLHILYEIHCKMLDIVPEPRPMKSAEVNGAAAHYAREADRDAEEYAYLVAQAEREFAADDVPTLEWDGEADVSAPEQVSDDSSDDLP